MLNTEADAVVARGDQRKTFSPGRVVGAKQASPFTSSFSSLSNSSSSPLSSSPLGQLWGAGKRFSEEDESSFFPEGSSSADYKAFSSTSDFNSGFPSRYGGSGTNLFAGNYYPSPAYAGEDDGADLDNTVGYDMSHLNLADFDDHDDGKQTSPQLPSTATAFTPTSNSNANKNSVRSLKAQSMAVLSSMQTKLHK